MATEPFSPDISSQSSTVRVIKNSLWLIIQPLLLNVISIAVSGYIARSLGTVDFGKFKFTFAFISMFIPIANFGLRPIAVRSMAKDKDNAALIFGEILSLRFVLCLVTLILTYCCIFILRYDQIIFTCVLIYSLTIIIRTLDTTLQDAFQAFEKMKYVALSRLVSGISLTVLSVVVLLLGYRLYGIIIAYTLGPLLGLLYTYFYMRKVLFKPQFIFNWRGWYVRLKSGLPFFIPVMVGAVGWKMGVVFLSKFQGDAAVGIYSAASNLLEKLIIIPDGIGASVFPAIASLYGPKPDEARHVFRQFYLYLLLLALPITVGTILLAKPIILLIYGVEYIESTLVLQVLILTLSFSFIRAVQGWTLSAIHFEKQQAVISISAVFLFVIFNYFLVKKYAEIGAAGAGLLVGIYTFVCTTVLIRKHFTDKIVSLRLFYKVLLANLLMGLVVYGVMNTRFIWGNTNEWINDAGSENIGLFLLKIIVCVLVGVVSYAGFIFLLRIVTFKDFDNIKKIFKKNKTN